MLYKKRMQIEEAFRDMKSLFGFKKTQSKTGLSCYFYW
ncbi:TPA: hypothetical protein ENS27_12120 [bacterium]|nr:hypothetical protein [bacterium]